MPFTKATYEKLESMTDEEQKKALGPHYDDWVKFRALSESEKADLWAGIDGLIEDAKKAQSKAEKIEALKGTVIRDVKVTREGRITGFTVVKDCIAREMTFSDHTTITVDDEVLSN